MGELIRMQDHIFPWHEAFRADGPGTTMQVFVNDRSGEVDVVSSNDDGESITVSLDPVQRSALLAALAR